MINPSDENVIAIRSSLPQDAAKVNALFIERKFDSEPTYPNYTERRIRWFREFGEDRFRQLSVEAQLDSVRYLMKVALFQNKVVGYARAEAAPNDSYCWWRGLTVARELEGQGIGRQLEKSRQAWALRHGRPIRALVATTNERSIDFLQQQGFHIVEIREPNHSMPIRFYVMELGEHALNSADLRSDELVIH